MNRLSKLRFWQGCNKLCYVYIHIGIFTITQSHISRLVLSQVLQHWLHCCSYDELDSEQKTYNIFNKLTCFICFWYDDNWIFSGNRCLARIYSPVSLSNPRACESGSLSVKTGISRFEQIDAYIILIISK